MFAAIATQARQDQATPDPKFTAAMQKGEAALKARRFEEAIDAFKQANAIRNKTSAAAFHGLGRAYHGLGAFKSEAENCAEGLKHVGDDRRLQAMLQNQRGMALFSLADKNTDKEIRDAEAEFRSALVMAEAPPIAWYNLGVVLLKQSRDAEGLVALQAYIDSGVRAPEIDLAKKMIENPRRGRENYAPDYAFASLARRLRQLEGSRRQNRTARLLGPLVRSVPGGNARSGQALQEIPRRTVRDARHQLRQVRRPARSGWTTSPRPRWNGRSTST